MGKFEFTKYYHRRYNPLTGDWVLVSPHRTKRPWQSKLEKLHAEERPQHDEECYLYPRNERAGGQVNPDYKDVFAFQNDFSALIPDIPEGKYENLVAYAYALLSSSIAKCYG